MFVIGENPFLFCNVVYNGFALNFREPRLMSSQDVQLALRSRPEFDLFTNVGLGTKYRQARRQPEDPSEEDRRLRNAEKVS